MRNKIQADEYESSLSVRTVLYVLLAMVLGVVLAVLLLPGWLPGMANSLLGSAPKGYWYLSRGSGLVAMGLLWLSMLTGLGITDKLVKNWPGNQPSFALHEYFSLLGLAFGLVHGLLLMGDRYINFSFFQVLVPFSNPAYRPVWVGLGQISLWAWAIINLTFYIRRRIGTKTWRFIHYASFLAYVIALFHGLFSGTDTSLSWAQGFYWFTGGSLLFLFTYRVLEKLLGGLIDKSKPIDGKRMVV